MADETWIGGDPANRHASKAAPPVRFKPSQGNFKTDKVSVLSLIDKRSGEVRSRIVPDVSGPTLRKAIADQVDMAQSHLQTDSWTGYRPVGNEFVSHQSVNHKAGEYVRGEVSTNMAEGFFSQLKRSIEALTTTSVPPTCPATLPNSTSGSPPASCPTRPVWAG